MERIATIGFFDGVHLGHRYVFDCLLHTASEQHLSPLIVTFRQHPREVLQNGYVPQLLTTATERKVLLEAVSETLMLDFAKVYTWTAEQFMVFLRDEYDVRVILMGYDHHFGSDRLPSHRDYVAVGERVGVTVCPLVQYKPQVASAEDGLPQHVSSTEIRTLLSIGKVQNANELLGYAYTLAGTVVHGNAIGRQMGFPTANIHITDTHKLIPEEGVYKAEVCVCDQWYRAVLNIGTNPTVGNAQQTIEAFIIDFQGDIYGADIQVRLLSRLRDEQHFANLEALRAQIRQDIACCR